MPDLTKDNVDINIASQGLPSATDEAETVAANTAPKPLTHVSPVVQQGKIAPPASKPATQVSAAKPNPAAAKSSVTNPNTLTAGKIGVISSKTVAEDMGVTILLERNDGLTLQLPMTFTNKQDLYGTKNMFDLLGKILNLPKDQLEKDYPAFIKG